MDSKENKAMNENINLIEILKDAPIGIELYSPICGTVLFCSIDDDSIEVSVKNYPSSEPHKFLFDIHGVSYGEYGECLLFPSKDNRDWSTYSKMNGMLENVNKDNKNPTDN